MTPDFALEADDGLVLAWLVANGENNGGMFDWVTKEWAKR